METLSLIGNAFAGMMNPMPTLPLIVDVTVGIVFGSISGLPVAMVVILLLPVTFAMQAYEMSTPPVAFYIDGASGSLISVILINIPGTSSSTTTYFDGSSMAKKGETGKALGTGVVSFFLGDPFPFLVSMFVAPSMVQVIPRLPAIEYSGVRLFTLSMIAALAGTDMIEGLFFGYLSSIIALVGMTPIDGTKRFTFGINELSSGFDILPTLTSISAVAEMLVYTEEVKKMGKATQAKQSFKIKDFGLTWKEFAGQKQNALHLALVGTGIGALPGIGGFTAGTLSWMTAKKTFEHPEKHNTGIMDGVVASKTSSNAVIGGAFIPLLILGIPGDGVTAVLLGALMIHGLTPGPPPFMESTDLIYTIFTARILANVVMLVLGLGGMRIFVHLPSIPKYILLPMVLALCTVSALTINNRISGAQFIVILGILDYLMSKFKLPVAPLILSFTLCNLLEANLRQGLMLTQDDFSAFLTHLITAVFMVAAVLFMAWAVIKQIRNRKKETAGAT